MGLFKNTNYQNPQGFGAKRLLKQMNGGKHARLAKWAIKKVPIKKSDAVLDLGCGGGANLGRLLKECPKGQVVGLDHSRTAVKMSLRVNKKAVKNGRCQVVHGTVNPLPFWDGNFQVVTAFETVYFWPNLTGTFREVYRVLDKGGKFLIANCTQPGDAVSEEQADAAGGMKLYGAEELASRLRDAGFKRVKIHSKKGTDFTAVVATK